LLLGVYDPHPRGIAFGFHGAGITQIFADYKKTKKIKWLTQRRKDAKIKQEKPLLAFFLNRFRTCLSLSFSPSNPLTF